MTPYDRFMFGSPFTLHPVGGAEGLVKVSPPKICHAPEPPLREGTVAVGQWIETRARRCCEESYLQVMAEPILRWRKLEDERLYAANLLKKLGRVYLRDRSQLKILLTLAATHINLRHLERGAAQIVINLHRSCGQVRELGG